MFQLSSRQKSIYNKKVQQVMFLFSLGLLFIAELIFAIPQIAK